MNAPVSATEDLLYVVEDGIARLTFNRPQARNALTFAMYERMAEICAGVNDDRSIKVMILTGTGDKAFASGIEMGLDLAKVPHRGGGVIAAMDVLKGRDVVAMPKSKAAVA